MSKQKNAPTPVFSRNGGNSAAPVLINTPCHLTRAGKTRIVTPRKRIVMGGRWTVENGRRVYHVSTRWLVEWVSVRVDWTGVTRITVCDDYASAWELRPVADVELLEAAA